MFAKTDMSWRSHELSLDLKENDSRAFYVQPSTKRVWMVALIFCSLLSLAILGAARAPAYVYALPGVVVLVFAFTIGRKPGLTFTEI